jgi:hypothetical protein
VGALIRTAGNHNFRRLVEFAAPQSRGLGQHVRNRESEFKGNVVLRKPLWRAYVLQFQLPVESDEANWDSSEEGGKDVFANLPASIAGFAFSFKMPYDANGVAE